MNNPISEAWAEFEAMRKQKRLPITPLAKKRILNKLEDLYPGNLHMQCESLIQSATNGWTTVWAVNKEQSKQTKVEQLVTKYNNVNY